MAKKTPGYNFITGQNGAAISGLDRALTRINYGAKQSDYDKLGQLGINPNLISMLPKSSSEGYTDSDGPANNDIDLNSGEKRQHQIKA
jgi:hypothetical protein